MPLLRVQMVFAPKPHLLGKVRQDKVYRNLLPMVANIIVDHEYVAARLDQACGVR